MVGLVEMCLIENIYINVSSMIEKALIKLKMENALNEAFDVPDLKKLALEAVNYRAENSEFLFGRLTLLHYDMFLERTKEIDSVAAAMEFLILAGDILDDVVDQDGGEDPWNKVELPLSLNVATGLLLLGQKIMIDLPIDDIRKAKAQSYILCRLFQSLNGQQMDVAHNIQTEADYIYKLQ